MSTLEFVGAWITRLTPHTPPAAWLPYAAYAGTAIAALLIARATERLTASRAAAAAIAIAYVATPKAVDGGVGVLVLALAVLGAVTVRLLRIPRWTLLGLVAASAIVTGNFLTLSAWTLAGCGLASVAASIYTKGRSSVASAAAAVALVFITLVIVAARVPAASTSVPPAPAPMGHDRVTAASLRALLSNVPSGSALVADDTATTLAFRANIGAFDRAHVAIEQIANDPAVVRETLGTTRVFALPFAQTTLQLKGFEIVDTLHVADRGLAEVRAAADCVRATDRWQQAPVLAGKTRLALVSDRASRRGPVVIYLVGTAAIRVEALDWPARTLRGFTARTFDLQNAQDRQDLAGERAEDLGPEHLDLGGAGSITRVAMWRMPDAALALPVRLSAPATRVDVRLSTGAEGSVSVCPVFPATVSAIR